VRRLLKQISQCRVCEKDLPCGPRPILRISSQARVLMVGQAPGIRVHLSGIPWRDPSGERLRRWLGVDDETFYDPRRFAIVPMGMCYPGTGANGDLPPRPECAPLWHSQILAQMPHIKLTILIGRYAHLKFLPETRSDTLTTTVAAWSAREPSFMALPHPSPRNLAWFKRNPWFETDVLPILRTRVGQALS